MRDAAQFKRETLPASDLIIGLKCGGSDGLSGVTANPADKAKAIGVVDANVARINAALKSFPNDAYMHALAGYAAKNVFESSRGTELLSADQAERLQTAS